MPWSVNDVDRHKKGLTPAEKKKWVKIANAVLRSSGDEGRAIRIANARCCNEDLTKFYERFNFVDDTNIDSTKTILPLTKLKRRHFKRGKKKGRVIEKE